MKRPLVIAAMIGIFGGASVFTAGAAKANNPGVESALAGYSDTTVFYAALLNTGVLSELDPNTHYTIFVPTNEAFAAIRPSLYPCFYSAQCRAQVAEILRDHIAVGRRTLTEMIHDPEVSTIGHYRVYAESPYVGSYSIGNQNVLSTADVHGNMLYRIDGVIITNQQLAQFRAMPPLANAVTQEKTIVTYQTPTAYPVPGGYPGGATETVTEKTYVTPAVPTSTTVVYPDGTQTRTTEHVYVAPGSYVEDDGTTKTTTVTRSVTSQP